MDQGLRQLEAAFAKANALPGNDRILIAASATGTAWKPGAPSLAAWGVWNLANGSVPPKSSTFTIDGLPAEQVSLLGGYDYDGNGEWDIEANPTVLSGDLAGNDGAMTGLEEDPRNDENAWRVLTVFDLGDQSHIDGLTIERGNFAEFDNQGGQPLDSTDIGGGIYLTAHPAERGGPTDTFAEPYIQNCTIQFNAADAGGAIAASRNLPFAQTGDLPSVRIRTCTIRANRADWFGGGVHVHNGKLDMAGTLLVGNSGGVWAGGVHLQGATFPGGDWGRVDASVVHCTIAQNYCAGAAGAGLMLNYMTVDSEVSIQSSILATNRADRTEVNPEGTYADFSSQIADASSGFLRTDIEFVSSAKPDLDLTPACRTLVAQDAERYSVIDPLFVDSDWAKPVAERDYHLHRCSPLRDLGQDITQPGTPVLPIDLSDVDHDGDIIEWLPAWDWDGLGAGWSERIRDSYPKAGQDPEEEPLARADIGAIEHDLDDCPYDITGDGQVDGADLGALLGAWTDTCSITQPFPLPPIPGYVEICDIVDRGPAPDFAFAPCLCADYNRDRIVDGADLAVVLGAFNSCPSGAEGGAPEGAWGGDSAMGGGDAFVSPTDLAWLYGFGSLDEFSAWLGTLAPAVRDAILAPLVPGQSGGMEGGQ